MKNFFERCNSKTKDFKDAVKTGSLGKWIYWIKSNMMKRKINKVITEKVKV